MSTTLTTIIREDAVRIAQAVDLSPLEGKRILITGATGLIGTYLTAVLEEGVAHGLDAKVVCVARSFPSSKTWDIGKPFTAFIMDLCNLRSLEQLPIFDVIFHAAGYGQPAKFMEAGLNTITLNTTVLSQLLQGHLTEGGTMLFASSSEVYSGCTDFPFKEESIGTTNPQHPRACYIEAKRCGEAICNVAHKEMQSKMGRCVAARIALAYGPGTLPGDSRVINQFIHAALVNKRITLRDSGIARRTYCYISDTVGMLLHTALYGRCSVYNVGGRSNTDIRSLAILIRRMVGDVEICIPPEVLGADNVSGAPDHVQMDIQRITSEFHKTHFVSLREGLERTIKYQQLLYA